ncbi:hypothetical protein B5X24_HaOG216905 [Helicoverpa armigera]|uniref:Uncharacterized protein n=1 Tax=Helicoverpa armigera TaxID=29058 RepID=A0A2W1BVT0_HELAM|nr:hypothetical protein B5X24_HaOG216905 [Helicoverpa armigera]
MSGDSAMARTKTRLVWTQQAVRGKKVRQLIIDNTLKDFGEDWKYGYWTELGNGGGIGYLGQRQYMGFFPC